MKWSWMLVESFHGNPVIPEPILYDFDGTILSAVPFSTVYTRLHYAWHMGKKCPPEPTPTYSTTVGQYCSM